MGKLICIDNKRRAEQQGQRRTLGTSPYVLHQETLDDRIKRIRASLEKINRLMAELKRGGE